MTEKQRMRLERARKHALLFIKRDANIRTVAKETGYSKNTIHLDLYRIEKDYPDLFKIVLHKIIIQKESRHIRGGEATKNKYLKEGK